MRLKMNPSDNKKEETESLECKNYSLKSAVREGRLDVVKELVKLFGPSYLKEWPEGNKLLRDAFNRDREIAKVLLLNGLKVNDDYEFSLAPLHYAAIYGDAEIVEMLLDRNAKIDAKDDRFGQTSLHHAIEGNKIEVVKLLLTRGACVNVGDKDGKTPLHYAVEPGSEEVTRLVLQYNPDVNINADCGTPLHLAVKEGKLQIVSDLLNQGAHINSVCTSSGYTPLHIASVEGRADVAGLLLLKGADVDAVAKGNLLPLYMATKEGHCDTVKLLLEHNADVDAHNEDGKTALYCAVEMRFSKIVKEILRYSPCHSNKSNRSSLYSAIQKNHRNIVEILVEHDFGVRSKDINNCELLHSAVKFGYLPIVEKLLYYGANVNMEYRSLNSYTLLHTATIYGQTKMAHYLIRCGADVNAEDLMNSTPLFYAVQHSDLEIIKMLLTNGAKNSIEVFNTAVGRGCIEIVEILFQCSPDIDISHTDIFGRTALYISAEEGHEILTRMLLDKGAILNAKNENGNTALHIATTMGHIKVVEMLLEYGAEVNCKSYNDITPLHIATKRQYLEIVNILIKFDADLEARDAYGRTALNIAQFEMKPITLALLQNCGDINKSVNMEISFALACTRSMIFQQISPGCYDVYETYAKIIVRHIVKLIANKSFVNEAYLRTINANLNLKQYYIKCEREIEEMKNEKIYNTNVSFYNILMEDAHQLSTYANNESIIEAFESSEYEKMFPIYADVLQKQFREGQERQCCIKSSIKSFNSIYGCDLSHSLVNKIFSYFNHSDLKYLSIACPYYIGGKISTNK